MANTETLKRARMKYNASTKSINIAYKIDEYNRIKAYADRDGLTVAAYVRQAIVLQMRDDDAIKGRIDVVPCRDD